MCVHFCTISGEVLISSATYLYRQSENCQQYLGRDGETVFGVHELMIQLFIILGPGSRKSSTHICVHSVLLSNHIFLCVPCIISQSTVPCKDSLETLLRLDVTYYVRATIPSLFSAGLVVAGMLPGMCRVKTKC